MELGKSVIVIILTILVFCMFRKNGGFRMAGRQQHSNHCSVMWFHRPSCGYCVKMKDEWEAFEGSAPSNVHTMKIDTSDPANAPLAKKFGVKSVPHIVKVADGKAEVYSGERTVQGFMNWVNNAMYV